MCTGGLDERMCLGRGGHCFTPVANNLDARVIGAQFIPVLGAADVRARAFMDSNDSCRRRRVESGAAGVFTLSSGEQSARFGAHQMVGLGG